MAYESVTLGTKWSIRVQDLTAADALQLKCMTCNHEMKVAPHVLYHRYPAFMRIRSIDKDFKCTKCNATALITWTVVRAHFEEDSE
jgi:transcription elongation factor Elf1